MLFLSLVAVSGRCVERAPSHRHMAQRPCPDSRGVREDALSSSIIRQLSFRGETPGLMDRTFLAAGAWAPRSSAISHTASRAGRCRAADQGHHGVCRPISRPRWPGGVWNSTSALPKSSCPRLAVSDCGWERLLDHGMALECPLPHTARRLDCMITPMNARGGPPAMVLEGEQQGDVRPGSLGAGPPSTDVRPGCACTAVAPTQTPPGCSNLGRAFALGHVSNFHGSGREFPPGSK